MGRAVRIAVAGGVVSGLFLAPAGARQCLVLAHGAGAGMAHPFMAAVAEGLAARGMATLRYQFPYMESGSKRPDRPEVAMACVRAAVHSRIVGPSGGNAVTSDCAPCAALRKLSLTPAGSGWSPAPAP